MKTTVAFAKQRKSTFWVSFNSNSKYEYEHHLSIKSRQHECASVLIDRSDERWIVAVSGKYQLLDTANVRKLKWTLRYWLAMQWARESVTLHEIANWKTSSISFRSLRFWFVPTNGHENVLRYWWVLLLDRSSPISKVFAWFFTANTLRNLPIRYLCEIAICKVHVFQFCKSIIGGHQMNDLFLFHFSKKNMRIEKSWRGVAWNGFAFCCLFVWNTAGEYSHAAICVDRCRCEAASFFPLLHPMHTVVLHALKFRTKTH